jgi:hypothetical protein
MASTGPVEHGEGLGVISILRLASVGQNRRQALGRTSARASKASGQARSVAAGCTSQATTRAPAAMANREKKPVCWLRCPTFCKCIQGYTLSDKIGLAFPVFGQIVGVGLLMAALA